MQEVQRERLRRDPLGTATTPGDLAWWLLQHPPATATPKRVELFVTPDGEVVAWAVLWLPVTLTYGVRGDDQGVHHEVLDWFAAAAEGGEPLDVALLETDVATRSALESRGFALAEDEGFLHHMAAELATEPRRPALPEGYRLRHVAGERDLPGRVDAHRSAFDPSRVTVESYREVTRTPAYRPELDVVAEAPDGTIAACALAWLDEVSASGSSSLSARTPTTVGAGSRRPCASRRCGGCAGSVRGRRWSTPSTDMPRRRCTSASASARSAGTCSTGSPAATSAARGRPRRAGTARTRPACCR
jgi:hypothetical protein